MKPLQGRDYFLPLLILLIGLMVTFASWRFFDAQVMKAEQLRFNRYSERVITTIQERLLDHERLLQGGRGLFYASKSVGFEKWFDFVNAQNIDLYPGILGLGYIFPVQRGDLPKFVAEMRKQAPSFEVKTKGDFPDLYVITQIEPLARNRQAWGLDIGQEANRRAAAEEAMITGKSTLTRRITLVQDQRKTAGFLMLLPLYHNKAIPQTASERKREFYGWVYVPIRIDELMSGIVEKTESMIDFEVIDGGNTNKNNLIYDADGHITRSDDQHVHQQHFKDRMFHKKSQVNVEGRIWTVYTSTRPEFESTAASAHWVPIVGLLLSVAACFAMWSLVNARRRALALAEGMTIEVREREQRWQLAVAGTNAGIWDWNVLTNEVFYSPRWLAMMGLKPGEIEANRQVWSHRVHAEDLAEVEESILAHFRKEVPAYVAEYRLLHADGSYHWVKETGQAQWDESGRVLRMVGSMTDISQRKRAEAELRDSEARIHAVVDSVMDAIVVIDENGRISSFNTAAERIFGYSIEEIQGKNVSLLMPEPYRSEHAGYIRRYLDTGKEQVIGKQRELVGRRKDGSTFPMELAVARLEIKGRVMFTGIVRDITERQKVDRMKKEFVSTVSHELRTPLTSIRGSLGLVVGGALGEMPAKMRQLIDIAYNNSERLIRLINDILDIEKIESGKLEVKLQTQLLMPLIEQAITANEAYAAQYQVRYALEQSAPHAMVEVDADRMMQILANLLSNAAKFSPLQGVVTIKVTEQGDRVRVSVRDQGNGIPEAYRDKMFQKFTQADSSDTRQKGGTGLGLAISKALVERMQGEIGFETETGNGTTFYFELPLRGTALNVEDKSSVDCILVCESDAELAHSIAQSLEQAGYQPEIVADAKHAKWLLEQRNYSAVTVDVSASNMEGHALLAFLRESVALRELPVVAVAQRGAESNPELQGASVALLDWLQAPVDQTRFLSVVRQALHASSQRKLRILHVEDDLDIHQVCAALCGDEVIIDLAPNLAGARQQLQAQEYDLVILDLVLPDGNGWELLPEISQRKPAPPVLVFSAQELSRQDSSKVSAVLVKSQTSNQTLIQTLKSLLDKSRAA